MRFLFLNLKGKKEDTLTKVMRVYIDTSIIGDKFDSEFKKQVKVFLNKLEKTNFT